MRTDADAEEVAPQDVVVVGVEVEMLGLGFGGGEVSARALGGANAWAVMSCVRRLV